MLQVKVMLTSSDLMIDRVDRLYYVRINFLQMSSPNSPSFGKNDVYEDFQFGGSNGMWLTKSRKRNSFVANWSLSRIPAGKSELNDQDVSGFVKISGRKGRVRVYHDVDNNSKLNRKDELIGSLRGGKRFGASNDFGYVKFAADAIGKPVKGDKEFEFSYYFELIPSDADSDVDTLKVPVSSGFLIKQEFVGKKDMSVSDFENMVNDTL